MGILVWNGLVKKRFYQCEIPANIYLFKVNDKNTRKKCETCSKLTTKTPEQHQWRCSGDFIVNFEYTSHLFLVFLIVGFEQVNVS